VRAASLACGEPTIVDAAFLRRHERQSFLALAGERAVPFAIVHCRRAGRDPARACPGT